MVPLAGVSGAPLVAVPLAGGSESVESMAASLARVSVLSTYVMDMRQTLKTLNVTAAQRIGMVLQWMT